MVTWVLMRQWKRLQKILRPSIGYLVIETEDKLEDHIETLDSRILKTAERKALVTRAAAQWHDFDADTEESESADIQDFL